MTTVQRAATPAVDFTPRARFLDRWRDFGRAPRLMGIDVARGLAVFGMIAVHVGISEQEAVGNPADWTALVEGRSSILFAVVAGVSVALATGRGDPPTGEALRTARLRMAGRALAVLAIGLLLELLGTGIAVILPMYGVLFLIMLPFLGLRRRTLTCIAVALTLLGPLAIATVQALTLGGSGDGVRFLLTGSYPLTVWLPLMLAGLVVGRSALGESHVAASVLGLGVFLTSLGYMVGSAVNGSLTAWLVDPMTGSSSVDFSSALSSGSVAGGSGVEFGQASASFVERLATFDAASVFAGAFGVSPHSGGTFEIIGSGGVALVIIGTCLLLARWCRWLLVPIAAVGSMPLTAYAFHVLSFAVLLSPLALAPSLQDGRATTSFQFWVACVVVLLVTCTFWALMRGRGPLERATAWAAQKTDAAPMPFSPGTPNHVLDRRRSEASHLSEETPR